MRKINDDLLRELWSTALSDKEVAARLGHHRSIIWRRAETIGLKSRQIARAEREAAIAAFVFEGQRGNQC